MTPEQAHRAETYWLGYRHGLRVHDHSNGLTDHEHALRLDLHLIGTTNKQHRAFALGELRGYREATRP